MRLAFLLRYFGRFHVLVAGVLIIPLLVGLFYDAKPLVWSFLVPSMVLLAGGLLMALAARLWFSPPEPGLRRREGFLLVSFSWILIILYGALPFRLSGEIADLAAAIFESASGFTTTGATVLSNIEILPHSLLFWRSFSHWLGGMGIIVLSVAILPELAVGGMQLFAAESSGIGVDKLAPRIAETARRLWALYVIMTAVEMLLLLSGGMSGFDAVTHAFSTTATGGFSPRQDSVGHFDSTYIDGVIIVFMFLAGTNFALQYRVFVRGDVRRFFTSSEVRLYAALAIAVTLLVTADLVASGIYDGTGEGLRYGAFQVVSILTTTGFGTADFDQWPTFSKFCLVILMTVGGCAGSTAGGLKVIRLVVVLKHATREFRRLIYPRVVKPVTIDGRALDEEILWSILGFFLLYMMAFLGTVLLLSALEHQGEMDLVTATTASLSALNSIGPGLGRVGATENFAFIHPSGKLALSFCMVLGRLEIYTLLILFVPRFWARSASSR